MSAGVSQDVRRFHLPGTGVPARKPVPQIITPKPERTSPKLYPAELQRQEAIHSRSRTASSGVFPPQPDTMQVQSQHYGTPRQPSPRTSYQPQQYMAQPAPLAKRTPSNATNASIVSTNPHVPMRQNSGSSLQRSTSSRSGGSPTSYVALMRKQKATVWSDRAQVCYDTFCDGYLLR